MLLPLRKCWHIHFWRYNSLRFSCFYQKQWPLFSMLYTLKMEQLKMNGTCNWKILTMKKKIKRNNLNFQCKHEKLSNKAMTSMKNEQEIAHLLKILISSEKDKHSCEEIQKHTWPTNYLNFWEGKNSSSHYNPNNHFLQLNVITKNKNKA